MYRQLLAAGVGLLFTALAWSAGYKEANKDRIEHQGAEIRGRIMAGMKQGYRFLTLEQYLTNVESLPQGSKVAVAGHYRDRNSISDATRLQQAYVLTDNATSKSKAELLRCLKATVALNAPCPVVILGRISSCSVTTYGYSDGKVACIDVRETWTLWDIDDVWSMDEVWGLTPLNEEILGLQK